MISDQKIVIVCGPTAVGKTGVGVELAGRFTGEIVSADSQQVWRGFDLGTAKPSREERTTVRHHLVDVADPKGRFDAARFVKLADAAIDDVTGRGRVPFVVGGTGMYIRMLLHGVCDAPPRDEEMRDELVSEIVEHGLPHLYARLEDVDPETAGRISPNDHTRIVRALEIHQLTGEPASRLRGEHGFGERRYDALKLGLKVDRWELYRRIDERCERMVERGLVGEVKGLLEKYGEAIQPFLAVGYKEMLAHVRGKVGLEESLVLMKRNTRRFAKRQMTWFRADPRIRWYAPDNIRAMANAINAFLKS